jgi:hypothetical protein
MRRLILPLLLLAALGYAGYFVYLAPLWAGATFAGALMRFDARAMDAALCPGTPVDTVLGEIGLVGDQLVQMIVNLTSGAAPPDLRDAFAESLQVNGGYDPLAGQYIFHYRLAGAVDVLGVQMAAESQSPPLALTITRGPLRACVTA